MLIGGIFKLFGTMMNGAGSLLAGTAIAISATSLAVKNKIDEHKTETVEEEQKQQKMRITSGKYKIVDIDNNLDILTSTDDFTEARAWLCEYRTNGYRVMLQTK